MISWQFAAVIPPLEKPWDPNHWPEWYFRFGSSNSRLWIIVANRPFPWGPGATAYGPGRLSCLADPLSLLCSCYASLLPSFLFPSQSHLQSLSHFPSEHLLPAFPFHHFQPSSTPHSFPSWPTLIWIQLWWYSVGSLDNGNGQMAEDNNRRWLEYKVNVSEVGLWRDSLLVYTARHSSTAFLDFFSRRSVFWPKPPQVVKFIHTVNGLHQVNSLPTISR